MKTIEELCPVFFDLLFIFSLIWDGLFYQERKYVRVFGNMYNWSGLIKRNREEGGEIYCGFGRINT